MKPAIHVLSDRLAAAEAEAREWDATLLECSEQRTRLAAAERVVEAARHYLDAEDRQANEPDYTNGESLILANGVLVNALERYGKAYSVVNTTAEKSVSGKSISPSDLNSAKQEDE